MNNKNKIEKLVKHIVKEAIDIMHEEHQRGEWWIDETGNVTYCDNNVSDFGHEAIVTQTLCREILEHFGINEDEPSTLDKYEETLKDILHSEGKLNDDEILGWDNMRGSTLRGPADVIIKKLLEDKVFKDPNQAKEAVFIAYGSQSTDARDYAMKYWNWKIMKTFDKMIEIQTWHLKVEDLGIIVRGIWDIMEHDSDDENDPDNIIGDDGFPGPRINVTVQASGKLFKDIPLAVLEKRMPQNLHNYQSGVHVGYTENLNEDFHHLHKEYRLFEGNNYIMAIFEDGSRLKFDVHFRNKHKEDKEKWRHRAFTTWKSLASNLHNAKDLTEAGNPIQKSWKECFEEALKDPKLQEFIRNNHHQRVFDDKGYPASGQGKPAPCVDPVNFTNLS